MDPNKQNNPNPCCSCTRVRDPRNCENKHCTVWRKWFSERWEEIREYYVSHGLVPQLVLTEVGDAQTGSQNSMDDSALTIPDQAETREGI